VNVWNAFELQHKLLKELGFGFGTASSLAIAEQRPLFPPLTRRGYRSVFA
jgi:hypothetical protein